MNVLTGCSGSTGEVYSFGFPKYGRLGHGDEAYQRLPKRIDALKDHRVTQITTFGAHSGVLTDKAQVWMWGSGKDGRLGQGDDKNHSIPVKVTFPDSSQKVTQLVCGFDFTTALTNQGQLYTWGSNQYGQLGRGDRDPRKIPERVTQLEEQTSGMTLPKITKVGCGVHHMGAISENGELMMWGRAEGGRLGGGEEQDRLYPHKLTFKESEGDQVVVESIACGGSHTAALVQVRASRNG